MRPADYINLVPDIESKSYLEIGMAEGTTFFAIKAGRKVGVDIDPGSDAYFAAFDDEPFDVVFIDGDHRAEQVVRDINNSRRVLNPGGVIFVHDLVPPEAKYTAPEWCGDGYRILDWCMNNYVSFQVLNEQWGLTRFDGLTTDVGLTDVGYEEFVAKLGGVPVTGP